MLKFEFSKYMDRFIDQEKYTQLMKKKEEILEKFHKEKMTGWYHHEISSKVLNQIKQESLKIRSQSDVLLVIGIGGSYMGSYALQQLLCPSFKKDKTEVIYIGTNLSATYINEVLDYVKDKEVSVNVISKSGTTLEIKLTYELVKDFMEKKYSKEEAYKRIIVTTNTTSGYLKEEIDTCEYTHFDMPDDIGGRYSMITPAHLLPMAVMNLDIDGFLEGYYAGKEYLDDAYLYAVIRKLMYDRGKYIENYSIYEPKMYYYTEFLKQLFGESEGKDGKGIFPVSTVNTRDLHSLGQFLQEGNKVVFETVLKINRKDDFVFDSYSFQDLNNTVMSSVMDAHYEGNVPNLMIEIERDDEKSMGEVTMFFMLAAAFSAYLFDVDPFNQPGVEKYKNIMNQRIDYKKDNKK